MDTKQSDDQQETEKRRDEVLRHILNRPPQPRKPLSASKHKTRPASKGRVRKGKSGA
ncbi:MAG: hypothetical protein ACLQJR_20180 [Stellaceae bacterium]